MVQEKNRSTSVQMSSISTPNSKQSSSNCSSVNSFPTASNKCERMMLMLGMFASKERRGKGERDGLRTESTSQCRCEAGTTFVSIAVCGPQSFHIAILTLPPQLPSCGVHCLFPCHCIRCSSDTENLFHSKKEKMMNRGGGVVIQKPDNVLKRVNELIKSGTSLFRLLESHRIMC